MGILSRFKQLFSKSYQNTKPKKKRRKKRVKGQSVKRGYPPGYPGKKDYHTKKLFGMRFTKSVMVEFKGFCKKRGYFPNRILEIYMRNVLIKNSIDKVKVKVRQAKNS